MYLRRKVLALIAMVCFAMLAASQDKPAPNPEVMAYIQDGRDFFLKHYYSESIPLFEKALAMERKRPSLDQFWWRILVDDLGVAYGASGNLKKAKATYEYGLAKDPKYYLFNYNMACTYAELDDADKAISYLRLTYKSIEEITTVKPKIDPWSDPSFKKLMNNDKFVSALMELVQK